MQESAPKSFTSNGIPESSWPVLDIDSIAVVSDNRAPASNEPAPLRQTLPNTPVAAFPKMSDRYAQPQNPDEHQLKVAEDLLAELAGLELELETPAVKKPFTPDTEPMAPSLDQLTTVDVVMNASREENLGRVAYPNKGLVRGDMTADGEVPTDLRNATVAEVETVPKRTQSTPSTGGLRVANPGESSALVKPTLFGKLIQMLK